jgi:hypothetical protein
MFSNIDEHARRLFSPASEAALSVSSRKSAHGVFSGGRHLGLQKAGALTCPGGKESTRSGKGVLRHPAMRSPGRGARGFDSTEPSTAEKAAALHRHRATGKGDRRSARSRQRAVKRATAGGWMTARWSGVVLGRSGSAARSGTICEVEGWRVFPQRSGERSPERMFRRVLVT